MTSTEKKLITSSEHLVLILFLFFLLLLLLQLMSMFRSSWFMWVFALYSVLHNTW